MNYCSNCGNELKKKDIYCPKCGTKIEKEDNKETIKLETSITKKDIATQIILSVLTCGIYSLYWLATITDDVNNLLDEKSNTSGVTVILLSILTCGLYLIYWNYDIGKKLSILGEKYNIEVNNNGSLIYMILSICKLDLVSYILIQSDLNKFGN